MNNYSGRKTFGRKIWANMCTTFHVLKNIQVTPSSARAKIIVNTRTGTIVVDENVMIFPVAVSHGNLSVVVSEKPFVSQPNAFANGRTVKGSASDIASIGA